MTKFPQKISTLKKGGYIVIDNRPCIITDMTTFQTGKHGYAKVKFAARDIFTGKKHGAMGPSTHNMDVPNVVMRTDCQVISYENDHLTVKDHLDETHEFKVNQKEASDEIKNKQKELIRHFENGDKVMATVMTACGESMVVDFEIA